MGFLPCKTDPDVWLKDCHTHYEYVYVYFNDIMVFSKIPVDFFDTLKNKYNYKLTGVGEPTYHPGGDFYHDPDGTLALGACSYIKKMLTHYEIVFGCKPKKFSSPMAEKDHPELDISGDFDEEGIKWYQSLIGVPQWLVALGCFDIQVGIATMSSYHAATRVGHLI
jgi:hypothetical protein